MQFSKKVDLWVAKCERGVHSSLFVMGDWRGDGCHRGLAKAGCFFFFFFGGALSIFVWTFEIFQGLVSPFLEIVWSLGLTSGDRR